MSKVPLHAEVGDALLEVFGGALQQLKDQVLAQNRLPASTGIEQLSPMMKVDLAMRARSLVEDIQAHVQTGIPRIVALVMTNPAGSDIPGRTA